MGTEALHKSMEEILESDVYCAICREVYVNPFILNCSHSFCKYCLIIWLNKKVCCPSCRNVAVFQTENLALRNTISKMISNTSAKFKSERKRLVKFRMESEAKAQQEGLVPLMEKKEAEMEADLGYRVRNGRRRRRVIGQWKGPNGATIWRTDMVGDDIVIHNLEDDLSTEPANDAEDEVRSQMEDDDETADEVEEVDVEVETDFEQSEDESNSDSCGVSILQFYDPARTDSDDSEYVAEEPTTSDEEEDDRMCDIDEESCDDADDDDDTDDDTDDDDDDNSTSSSDHGASTGEEEEADEEEEEDSNPPGAGMDVESSDSSDDPDFSIGTDLSDDYGGFDSDYGPGWYTDDF